MATLKDMIAIAAESGWTLRKPEGLQYYFLNKGDIQVMFHLRGHGSLHVDVAKHSVPFERPSWKLKLDRIAYMNDIISRIDREELLQVSVDRERGFVAAKQRQLRDAEASLVKAIARAEGGVA